MYLHESLMFHLECQLLKDIPQFHLYDQPVSSLPRLIKSVPLNYIWMAAFQTQPLATKGM